MDAPADDPLAAFLGPLLTEGRALLTLEPGLPRGAARASIAILDSAFVAYRLDVGGPLVAFDAASALAAAEVVRAAASALVDRSTRPEGLAPQLAMPGPPRTPAEHLSADLTLRFLPQVLRRARGLDPADPLVAMLVALLRAWPLSGALADLDEPPDPIPDFGGHPGLMALYVERLVPRERASWYPQGAAGDHVEIARRAAAKGRTP